MDINQLLKGYTSDDRLLREKEVAEFLKVSPHTLAVWRMKVTRGLPAPDLPFRKIGRSVRYRLGDLRAYIAACQQDEIGRVAGRIRQD